MNTDNLIKEVRVGNQILRIYHDEDSESPRSWDNLGTMVCKHKRYNLGDKHNVDFDDFNSIDELEKGLIKEFNTAVILPIFMYDHSGVTIRTTSFNDRWDSGQVGFILISKEKVRKEFNVKRINKKLIEKVQTLLEGEVKTYDEYLSGEVFSFELLEVKNCELDCEHEETIDSCGGFFGDDFSKNGITDHISKELAEALKAA